MSYLEVTIISDSKFYQAFHTHTLCFQNAVQLHHLQFPPHAGSTCNLWRRYV